MSFWESQKKRAANIRHFVSTNKLFMIIALVVVIVLVFGMIHGNQNHNPQTEETSQAEDAAQQTKPQTEQTELPAWRFYPSDLVILLVGGGICVIMIHRERKKAKEELD